MTFKDINRWDVWEMPNDIIPNFSSIGKETIHVPACILFRKSYSRYLACVMVYDDKEVCDGDKMVSYCSKSYESAGYVYTNDDQIGTPNPILHIVWNDLNLTMYQ